MPPMVEPSAGVKLHRGQWTIAMAPSTAGITRETDRHVSQPGPTPPARTSTPAVSSTVPST